MEETGSAASRDLAHAAPRLSQDWLARQYSFSAAALLRSISATHLVKSRPGFGQTIRPAKGSVLASRVIASYDPDPDYFFHWVRDSAIVMDALRCLIVAGALGEEALGHFEDFVAFSLRLVDLDGRAFLSHAGDFRQSVEPFFMQYVRSDSDLAEITGEHTFGEPRFNPDGTLDIIKWSRPQHDGPALRALAVMRFFELDAIGETETRAAMQTLIERDLAFIHHCWREPSFDIWEEELGRHYYTRLVQYAALADGARWIDGLGKPDRAKAYREAAGEIAQSLDEHWSDAEGFYLSRLDVAPSASSKDLDIATILAVIHADRREGAHSVLDPKVLATLARLENLFETAYLINQRRPEGCGPAMGRYAGDRYYSGGAYYFATLGAAQFYFRLAEVAAGATIQVAPENRDILHRLAPTLVKNAPPPLGPLAPERRNDFFRAVLRRGEMFMATVEAYAPASGELAEQFDQTTGAPASAKDLAWSHAAFITAFASRESALRMAEIRLERRGGSA